MLNNCRYARNNVLPKLVDSFRNNDYPITDKLKKVTSFLSYFFKKITLSLRAGPCSQWSMLVSHTNQV